MTQTASTFAVAPMIDWTDRHCRYFHRQMTARARLFTEMVVADAAIHGPRERLLGFDATEHPVVLQLGGSDPAKLAEAARIGEGFGYDEVNLNVGCPSDRVQSGAFGACLMLQPALVGACVAAMRGAVAVPVTVKCRIGVDDQDPEPALDALADAVFDAGAEGLWVHARKAWLQGLSPKENREIPPLDYGRVERLKARLPHRFIGINGGIASVASSRPLLEGLDGVMLGRAAYQNPADLMTVDPLLFGKAAPSSSLAEVVGKMADYAGSHVAAGGKLSHVTRHMLGLFNGHPGARQWRQILSERSVRAGAGPDLLFEAMAGVELSAA
ncbi:tRNA dihydrouridine(20/20a) synthase DusA [Aureimonas altamirensis]|uniref:tRNA dihydrouridine(20/20a) synthase DusA n=1 Tax=Aureimonas altamirensis TaxID=370622 RepID=UPI002036FD5C|nr:tRNA dihydrouridine(20/20a) synthase DusA [Aureimonas altamirensis]MCM2503022.1 tRNA dihydrouridine(20/20a) synthase DusA [Aureimonas altamirensis]